MKFGPIPTADALGAILAHSADLPDGRLRKGKELTAVDIERLWASGLQVITVAQLEKGDMHEDAAASALAAAFVPAQKGLRLTNATTGRVNVVATEAGVLCCDEIAINAVNAIDPMITIATLQQHKRVVAGDMVATIKIISYGVGKNEIERAADLARPLQLNSAVHKTVTLIETQVGQQTPSAKGRAAMATRLDRLGSTLTARTVVPHEERALQQAITEASGSMIMILTGSATSDAYDVAPEAVRLAGGEVTRFGMPVDPGNLLFTGQLGAKPIIGLPGCTRSLALNGADWVVERMICDVSITDKDIAGMGVGGLLKESPARNLPRAGGKNR